MSTNSCLQSKIDSLKQQINSAKLNVVSCLSSDASNKDLLEKNKLLTNKLQKYEEESDNDLNPQSIRVPILSITVLYTIVFFIIGIFYNVLLSKSIITIIQNQHYVDNVNQQESSYQNKWSDIHSCQNQYRFILFCIVSIITFAINFGIMYSLIMKGNQNYKAMKVITVCIVAIIGVMFLLINNINFTKIFENSVGFYLVHFLSPKNNISFSTFFNSLFVHDMFPKGGIDFSFLFTLFRLDNFGDLLKDIGTTSNGKYDFHLNSLNLENLNLLTDMIVTKNTIGHMCWILFSTLACTFVSLKFLMKNL